MRLASVCLFLAWFCSAGVEGKQTYRTPRTRMSDVSPRSFSGNLRVDLFAQLRFEKEAPFGAELAWKPFQPESPQVGTKSPWLAAGLSAAVPGLGEVYSKSYVKGAVFLGAEVASWIIYGIYTKKGNDRTNEFEAFANQNWSPTRYAQWTLDNLSTLNPSLDPNSYSVLQPGLACGPPFSCVNWNELNRLEADVGNGYSHRLPLWGEQQYYELIGKYPQYNQGWSDSDQNSGGRYYDNLSSNFHKYSGLRGDANDFFNVASIAVGVVVVNHVLSALDAARSAAKFNRRLEVSTRMEIRQVGEVRDAAPVIDLSLSF